MKKTKVSLAPLTEQDREQFILDNQWSFKHGALIEFGERDDSIDADGEIISRKTIESCLDMAGSKAYRIIFEDRIVGGVIVNINEKTNVNELDTLFVSPEEHSKGIGYGAWLEIEKLFPKTKVWKTCTPYFDKRNIHFYVNKCGFKVDEFWCEFYKPSTPIPDDEGPSEMFHFVKVMDKR